MTLTEQKQKKEIEKLELEIRGLAFPWRKPSFWFPVLVGVFGVLIAILQYGASDIRAQYAALSAKKTLIESTEKNKKLSILLEKAGEELIELQEQKKLNTIEIKKTEKELERISRIYDDRDQSLKRISQSGQSIITALVAVIDTSEMKDASNQELSAMLAEAKSHIDAWYNSSLFSVEEVEGNLVIDAWDYSKEESVRLILAECKERGVTLPAQIAYVLATTHFETANYTVFKEAFWLSEKWKEDNLQYYPYYGRGYILLTWKQSYEKMGKLLGVDLVGTPELAIRPDIAASIAVIGLRDGLFTGRSLSDYITEDSVDFFGARRAVNGLSNSEDITSLAVDYLQKIKTGELPI